jgi:hypothetical protein
MWMPCIEAGQSAMLICGSTVSSAGLLNDCQCRMASCGKTRWGRALWGARYA